MLHIGPDSLPIPALLAGLEQAFAFFGGVPRELLFDQMRSVITNDERLDGAPAGSQCRVPPLQRALELHAPRLPTLPGQDQREGGAAGELRARQLLLRPGVPERP